MLVYLIPMDFQKGKKENTPIPDLQTGRKCYPLLYQTSNFKEK